MPTKKSRAKSVKTKKGFNKFEFGMFVVIFAFVGLITLLVSFAAPAVKAACAASPNPTSVGSQYIVSATGMPIDAVYDVFIGSPSGAMSWYGYGPETQNGLASVRGSQTTTGSWTYYFTSHHVNNSYVLKGQKIYASCSVNIM
jgi:hypothetical protein